MEHPIFRKKSLSRITSPEALSDGLTVTRPAVWLVLAALLLMLAGLLIWSASAHIDSFAEGTADVSQGTMRIVFDNEPTARNIRSGMTVKAGETESRITSVGTDENGRVFALAPSVLPDGRYRVNAVFRRTEVLSLLFR